MAEPTIICPNCKMEIKLTESLAAPLIEATRREYERRIAQKESEIPKRGAALSKARESIEEQITEKLTQERARARVGPIPRPVPVGFSV